MDKQFGAMLYSVSRKNGVVRFHGLWHENHGLCHIDRYSIYSQDGSWGSPSIKSDHIIQFYQEMHIFSLSKLQKSIFQLNSLTIFHEIVQSFTYLKYHVSKMLKPDLNKNYLLSIK